MFFAAFRRMWQGSAIGREMVYERSDEEVKAELPRAAGFRDFQR